MGQRGDTVDAFGAPNTRCTVAGLAMWHIATLSVGRRMLARLGGAQTGVGAGGHWCLAIVHRVFQCARPCIRVGVRRMLEAASWARFVVVGLAFVAFVVLSSFASTKVSASGAPLTIS